MGCRQTVPARRIRSGRCSDGVAGCAVQHHICRRTISRRTGRRPVRAATGHPRRCRDLVTDCGCSGGIYRIQSALRGPSGFWGRAGVRLPESGQDYEELVSIGDPHVGAGGCGFIFGSCWRCVRATHRGHGIDRWTWTELAERAVGHRAEWNRVCGRFLDAVPQQP